MNERTRALAFAIATTAWSPVVLAAPQTDSDAAFKNGLEQYAHANYTGAITTWESLLATVGEERGYKALYNLGLAYQEIGDVTRAVERYRGFVARAESRTDGQKNLAERVGDAKRRIREIEQTYGAVHVAAPKKGGLVLTRIGAAEPRAAGYVVYLAPGSHVIELYVGTDHAKRVPLDVVKGEQLELDTSLPTETVPVPTEPAPPPPAEPKTRPAPEVPGPTRDRTWLVVGGLATVVSTALPLSLYFVAKGKADDAAALPTGHSGYDDRRSEYGTWRTLYLASWALPVIALGVTVGGFALSSKTSKTSARAAIGPGSLFVSGQF